MFRVVLTKANNSLKPLRPYGHPVLMPAIVLGLVLLCASLIYLPGLNGTFLFDDEPNITTNEKICTDQLSLAGLRDAAFSMDNRAWNRPITRITFALNCVYSGLNPYAFKLTNLLIHIVNGVSVFLVAFILLEIHRIRFPDSLQPPATAWLAVAVAGVWLLHPLNLTSVLYIVQRMNSLAALFTFLGLVLYLRGRQRQINGRPGFAPILASFCVALPLGILCKENAALLPAFLLLIEWLFLGFAGLGARPKLILQGLFILSIAMPVIAIVVTLCVHPDFFLGGYALRSFDASQRLLTEARVLWFYIGLILLPGLSRLGIYHDDFPLSESLWDPVTTFLSVIALGAVVCLAITTRKKAPFFSFGILFFLLGHSVESSMLPLEIAHEHRNYVPILGVILPVLYYALLASFWRKTFWIRNAAVGVWVLLLASVTAVRADYWGKPLDHVLLNAVYHARSYRTNYEAGRLFLALAGCEKPATLREDYYTRAAYHFRKASTTDKAESGSLIALLWLDSVCNKPLDFVHLNELIARLQHMPLSPLTISNLRRLNQCQLSAECPIAGKVLDRLLATALTNRSLQPRAQASLLSEAMIRALARGELDGALRLSKDTVAADPRNAQHRLNMIHLLIASGYTEDAEREIEELNRIPLTVLEQSRLKQQEHLLTASKGSNSGQ